MTETDVKEFGKSLVGKSPYEIYKAIRDFDKENGRGAAMDTLQHSKEFGEYCTQQLQAFLDNRLALTQRDADNVEIWWKYSNHDFALEDIKRADAKVAKSLFVRSERFVNMNTNPTFLKFMQHIPDIQDEMDMPKIEGGDHIRCEQRQIIVDFVRFVGSGKKSSALIENGDWTALSNLFEHFPKMSSVHIGSLLDKVKAYNKENPNKQRTEREAFITRILQYRLENICRGDCKPNAEEVEFLETYLKDIQLKDPDLAEKTLAKLAAVKQELAEAAKASQAQMPQETQADAQVNPQPVEKPHATVINFEEESTQAIAENNKIAADEPKVQENIPSGEKVEEIVPEAPQQEAPEREDDSAVESPEEQPQKLEEEVQQKLPEQSVSADNSILNVDEIEPNNDAHENTQAAVSWQSKTLSSWHDWGQKNNKIVQEYKPADEATLAFKVYDNADKAKAGAFDADITYRKENDITVKGYKGKVPSDEVFAAIVAQAKKNGPEICFGDIKSSIFKAKLMLACLNDPEVKMVNQPKLSELTDLPEDLKAKLKEKLPRPTDHAQKRMQELKNTKTNRPSTDNRSKGSSDKRNEKSADRPHRTGNLDKNSGESKPLRPRNGNTSLPMKRDNQYE